MSVSENPPYNFALGATDQAGAPPFDLSKVVMRIFPLRANYHSLQLFCDRFINIAPECSHFEPAAPFALFCVINYGHMGNVASNLGYTSQNEVLFAVPLNWYRKVGERFELQPRASISPFIWVDEPASAWTGRNVFGWPKSVAWLTPGVNEWAKDPTAPRTLFSLSALMYRRLFAGQRQEPSVLLEVERDQPSPVLGFPPDPLNPINPWISWPRGVLRSLKLGGELLETATRLPTFGYAPWGKGANILEMMASTFGDYNPFEALPASNTINLKQFRHPTHPQSVSYQAIVNSKMSPRSFSRGGMLGEGGLLRGDLSGGYRIKLHRHPAWPIIEALGLEVAGDSVEDGVQVSTLEPLYPFWVEVDFEYGSGEVVCWRTRSRHWAPAPESKESLPEVDIPTRAECEEAAVRDAKSNDRVIGHVRAGMSVNDSDSSSPVGRLEADVDEYICEDCGTPHLYNTAQGSAVQQVYGPFHFPNTTVRVLPLLADWKTLMSFTDEYLNFPDGGGRTCLDAEGRLKVWKEGQESFREGMEGMPKTPRTRHGNLFVPWGRYVYMTITSYENITSELNVGFWARRRVAFSYPVKWYQWVNYRVNQKRPGGPRSLCLCEDQDSADPLPELPGHWGLKSFGLVSPFMYVDTTTAATVGREMNGWSVAEAKIICPETAWLKDDGPIRSAEDLMALETDVMPALNANQKTREAVLVEVTTRDPVARSDTEAWHTIASRWGERQAGEAHRKAQKAVDWTPDGGWTARDHLTWFKSIGMEVLFRKRSLNHVALKQFRDAKSPTEACLQAINVYPESIERVHDLRTMDETLYVAVHRYPTQPIVDRLGLDVKWTDTSQGQPVQYLQAVQPFWMSADIKAELGRDVAWRAGSREWQEGEYDRLYFDESEAYATPVGAALIADDDPTETQDFGSRRVFKEAIQRSVETWGGHGWAHHRRGHWDFLRDSDVDWSPQVAIESMLNHGWANLDPHREPLDPERVWDTRVPSDSIPNKEAREKFLDEYGADEGVAEPGAELKVIVPTADDSYWAVRPDPGPGRPEPEAEDEPEA